ncbi:MobF family relaxase [Rhodococcus sp. NPDC019627]|uniref:MobF family relaxase n=1 Tax=unclassified Rhodococcus (in: high G+C Gram-positive bacteria) TaxID=192944 RepID=UPI00340DF8C7
MTLHVLHAGDGYEYLTKQVATADRELEHGQELTDYYTAHGTPPGRWFGSALPDLASMDAGIDVSDEQRIALGQVVSETQMKALFGEGMHPNAEPMIAAGIADGIPAEKALKAARLGRKFPSFANEIPLLKAHRSAVESYAIEHGRRPNKAESQALMDREALRLFTGQHARPPQDRRELRSWISAEKSKVRQPVAGYDLVFTPPKSVSVVWALADDDTRREIERIHHDTITETLGWYEQHACFTRTGSTSQETQDTTGFVATLYDHYDSRAGDPNLHTHAVVSIKVRTESDGKWRALDGSTMHRYGVAASQRYNAQIMSKLHTELGFGLTARSTGRGRQDVVEVAEVPEQLREMFSSRRTEIEVRRDQLVAEYRAEHGRMPSPKAMFGLYQQANLDTREGKQQPQTLVEMQQAWRVRSAQVLGSDQHVHTLMTQWRQVRDAHAAGQRQHPTMRRMTSVEDEARAVLTRLENARATWALPHIHSAVEANFAAVSFPTEAARQAAVQAVTAHVLGSSVHLPTPVLPPAPDALRRRTGEFILTTPGSNLHTSHDVIAAEQTLLDATKTPTAYVAPQAQLDRVIAAGAKDTGRTLNAGQRALAEHFVGSGALLAVGIGPAGTGKTTSMKAVADTWQEIGYQVIALAPSAVAAETLGEEIGVQAHTLATLTYPWRGVIGDQPGTLPSSIEITPGTMLLVDEASLASTKDLAAITDIARARGAIVRLLGDPAQLDAVETGGALRLLAEETKAPELTDVVRFGDDLEQADNSLQVRAGNPESLELFDDRGWIHSGTATEMKDQAAAAYIADTDAGLQSIVMLSTGDDVREVNLAVQAHQRGRGIADEAHTTVLSDELTAGVGDTVLTRRNDRTLRTLGGRRRNMFVRNGDLWTVTAVNPDGSLTVRSKAHDGRIVLPAKYVRRDTELGYAATVHRSQGITVDTSHTAVTGATNRAGLYVAVTRGRTENHLYVPTEPGVTQDTEGMHLGEHQTPQAHDVLRKILAADNGHKAAITEIREATRHAKSPERLREAYLAAQTRLRDRWLDHLLDRSLPATMLATMEVAHPGSLAALRATLAEIHDRGDSATRVLNDALTSGELHTARDAAAVLNTRITKAVAVVGEPTEAVLPPLPPRVPHTDMELDDYARTVAELYAEARPAEHDVDGIGAKIRAYRQTRTVLDRERVRRPVEAVFDPETAATITADKAAWWLGRQLRNAALAGLDPAEVLQWHAHRLAEQGKRITAVSLASDIGPTLTTATRDLNARWLDENHEILREYLPVAAAMADHGDDPRWNDIAGRLRVHTTSGGRGLADLCAELAEHAGTMSSIGRVVDALDEIAPIGHQPTNPAAPHWLSSPDADAHTVDAELAQQLRDEYTGIAAAHDASVREIGTSAARAAEPDNEAVELPANLAWTRHLGPRPDETDLAAEWDRAAAEVHAYRSTYRVTDTTSLAGDRRDHKAELGDFHSVHDRVQTYQDHVDEHREEQQRQGRQQETAEHDRQIQEQARSISAEHGHQRGRRGS